MLSSCRNLYFLTPSLRESRLSARKVYRLLLQAIGSARMAHHDGRDSADFTRGISLQDIGCDDSNPSRSDLTKLLTGLDISEKGLSALNLQLGGEADDHDGPSGLKTHSSRVFVNRSLNMNTIKYVGFDMDYTLAIYKSPIYEQTSYDLIMKRLVEIGYPKELLDIEYDPSFPQRGLFFDKEYGNLLKLDMYGNILLCQHGFSDVDQAVIRQCYPNKFVSPAESRYFGMNTLFNLPEVYIQACLVNYYDTHADFKKLKSGTGVESEDLILLYSSIFQDIRMAVDYIHIEGNLKQKTIENLGLYIAKDERLPRLLKEIRDSKRKVFLITNSGWHYTDAVMEYLFDFPHGPERGSEHRPWRSYFDYIVVDAKKPLFFETGTALRQVDTKTGALKMGKFKGTVREGESVWAGGSSDSFCQLSGARGKEILFVGDHIFGDILRSKKRQGWRTFLVVPELNEEIRDWQSAQASFSRLKILEYSLSRMCRTPGGPDRDAPEKDIEKIRTEIKKTAGDMDRCHGSRFGSLFRSGSRQSYFAMQAMRYADLYAESFINLIHYPPRYLFRAPHQLMPHEQFLPSVSEPKASPGVRTISEDSPLRIAQSASTYHDEDDEDSDETAQNSPHLSTRTAN
ncbi:cytosolic purine 5'-nucleotidase-like [Sycon ciliatum]|uniref:cytosolic purine 5'-nucleotidase-like n=1 Tax=Sycon ciliatum TaxID=27933 RepID=UPI0031F6DFC7